MNTKQQQLAFQKYVTPRPAVLSREFLLETQGKQ